MRARSPRTGWKARSGEADSSRQEPVAAAAAPESSAATSVKGSSAPAKRRLEARAAAGEGRQLAVAAGQQRDHPVGLAVVDRPQHHRRDLERARSRAPT